MAQGTEKVDKQMTIATYTIAVLKDANNPMRLHHIQAEIRNRYKVMYETTTISAKIRKQCRDRLYPHGLLILSREDVGSRAHVYWLAKIRK